MGLHSKEKRLRKEKAYTGVCWTCNSKSNSYYGLPYCIEPSSLTVKAREKQTMTLRGFFCTLNCAKRYALDLPDSKQRSEVLALFALLTLRNYGRKGVIAAPKRHHLKMYGGHLTPEQYRQATHLLCDSTRKGGVRRVKKRGKQVGRELAMSANPMKPKIKLKRALAAFGLEEYLPTVSINNKKRKRG